MPDQTPSECGDAVAAFAARRQSADFVGALRRLLLALAFAMPLHAQSADPPPQMATVVVPVPVMLLYWTVTVAKGGPVEFIPDIYQRDAAVLRALKKTIKLRKEKRRADEVGQAGDD